MTAQFNSMFYSENGHQNSSVVESDNRDRG